MDDARGCIIFLRSASSEEGAFVVTTVVGFFSNVKDGDDDVVLFLDGEIELE